MYYRKCAPKRWQFFPINAEKTVSVLCILVRSVSNKAGGKKQCNPIPIAQTPFIKIDQWKKKKQTDAGIFL
jgi:hypothetical protein